MSRTGSEGCGSSFSRKYRQMIESTIEKIIEQEEEKIKDLAERMYRSINDGGLIYAFGTGHSHMLVEEIFYRAGGIAPVCPILLSSLMLHERAALSSKLERIDGIGEAIVSDLPISSKDVVVVFSNSGSNSAVVTFADRARKRGAYVCAITSIEHSTSVEPRNELGKKLFEVVDLTIDNHVPYGDACVKIGEIAVGPLSTVCGAFIINSIIGEVVACFLRNGKNPPVFLSSNTPNGDEKNISLVSKYRHLIPFL